MDPEIGAIGGSAVNKLVEFLRALEDEGYYGKVQLEYRNGRLELIRKEQTIKLQGTPQNGNNR